MNANKRVAINAMATYCRTLLRLALGLFSSRWVLQALGEVDYGLLGVVGLLIVLITFLNSVITGACSRFFAHSIGRNDLEDLIRWFNTGLSVHLFLSIVLVAFGYPIGHWAIDHYLNIPPDRIQTAHWVFLYSLISTFWSIATTPYIAMYRATQNIAEFTLWEIASILINFVFVYWLTFYKGDAWLMYSAFTVWISILLGIGKVLRARYRFVGCRINFAYWLDKARLKKMMSFSVWSLFGSAGYMARAQLPAGLLNKFFSPILFPYVNASYQVGGALANYTHSMAGSLLGAFTPHITTLTGANQHESVTKAILRASKFSTFLTLLFAIPLTIEVDYVLEIWLKNPPILAGTFCKLVILQTIIENLTTGHMSGIMATGNIKWYQITTGLLCIISIPIAGVVLYFGGSPTSVSLVIAICVAMCSCARLKFGVKLLGISISHWVHSVFVPIIIISIGTYVIGITITYIMPDSSFFRLCINTMVCCVTMIALAWYTLFDNSERYAITIGVKGFASRFKKHPKSKF